LLNFGVQLGLIQRSGNWHSIGDIKLGNGKSNALEFLRAPENRDVYKKLEVEVKAALFPPPEQEAPKQTEVA
ncbi:MAG: DNA recombination/repair protein RecA, partial [Planctomycetes bacterium]|nr:DNA recombination/repair protein RecA [Planctomycetota bacterium]